MIKWKFFRDLLELPIAMYYMLFKSVLAPILWGLIAMAIIVFVYVVITG